MVRYEGIVSKIERMIFDSLYIEYQFTGEILESYWASDFTRITNRIILDENGMLDLDKNRIEIISKDGREYMQLYDADGKEVHGITSMDYYEHLTEYICFYNVTDVWIFCK